jgi:ABC-type lipoprotein export system ATPase subunit
MLVEISELQKVYRRGTREVVALRDVSLSFEKGEFLAICGPSGCGKSTLLLTVGGLLRPTSGTVRVAGTAMYELNAGQRAEFRATTVGFIFQQFHLVPYLNVLDNVLAARLGITDDNGQDIRQRALELVDQLGLMERRYHRPHELSVGERQRVAMARAVLNRPRLLLADEPTGNLDRDNAATVLEYLARFRHEGGAVLLVTHDALAARQADRIVRMDAGRIVASGSGSAVP